MKKKMSGYAQIAPLYDVIMAEIDYEGWVRYVERIIRRFKGRVTSVVDLACGTGNSTFPWAERGYATWGIDLSPEMLEIARQKAEKRQLSISFSCQNLCRLQLPGPVDLAVCFQDGFNYLPTLTDLQAACRSIYRNLSPGGFLVFDLNYLPRLLPDQGDISRLETDRFSMSWRACYHEAEKTWGIKVWGEIKDLPPGEGTFHEQHLEKIYESGEVCSILTAENFTVLANYQAFTFDPPHAQTPRVVFIAQRV